MPVAIATPQSRITALHRTFSDMPWITHPPPGAHSIRRLCSILGGVLPSRRALSRVRVAPTSNHYQIGNITVGTAVVQGALGVMAPLRLWGAHIFLCAELIGGVCEINSSRVCVSRYSRIACWPSSQASCKVQGRPSPQARSSMMQRVTPKGPSTASTTSRSVIWFVGRASREPPPRPCPLSTRPAWESLAMIRDSRRRGMWASAEILSAVTRSPTQAR